MSIIILNVETCATLISALQEMQKKQGWIKPKDIYEAYPELSEWAEALKRETPALRKCGHDKDFHSNNSDSYFQCDIITCDCIGYKPKEKP